MHYRSSEQKKQLIIEVENLRGSPSMFWSQYCRTDQES